MDMWHVWLCRWGWWGNRGAIRQEAVLSENFFPCRLSLMAAQPVNTKTFLAYLILAKLSMFCVSVRPVFLSLSALFPCVLPFPLSSLFLVVNYFPEYCHPTQTHPTEPGSHAGNVLAHCLVRIMIIDRQDWTRAGFSIVQQFIIGVTIHHPGGCLNHLLKSEWH